MKPIFRPFLMLLIILLSVTSISYATPIKELRTNIENYLNQEELSIQGKVSSIKSIPLMKKGMYEVTDRSGSIMVVTESKVPEKGSIWKVYGRLEQNFAIAGKEFGDVLIETKRAKPFPIWQIVGIVAGVLVVIGVGVVLATRKHKREPAIEFPKQPLEKPVISSEISKESVTEAVSMPEIEPPLTKGYKPQETQEFFGEKAALPEGATVILKEKKAEEALAWLIVKEGGRRGKEFRISKAITTVGRAGDNDIVIDDKTVSKKHAKILIEDEKFYIQDLASANGTEVNGNKILKQELNDSDEVKLGTTFLIFKKI